MAGYWPDIPPHVADVIRNLPPEVKRGVKRKKVYLLQSLMILKEQSSNLYQ